MRYLAGTRYNCRVADRTTRDALLRLRKVNEIGAQRALVDAREELTRAADGNRRAGTTATAADEKLAEARAEASPRSAGRLAARERFLERLRENAARAWRRAEAARAMLAEADSALQRAQVAVETALRAREAAEAQGAALRVRAERQ